MGKFIIVSMFMFFAATRSYAAVIDFNITETYGSGNYLNSAYTMDNSTPNWSFLDTELYNSSNTIFMDTALTLEISVDDAKILPASSQLSGVISDSISKCVHVSCSKSKKSIPEPASLALIGLGFAGMGIILRRRHSGSA